jgi:hypothetical protein
MSVGLDLVKHLGDLALGVDYERAALDAHVLAPVHTFFLPHPIRLGDGVVGVGNQRVRQAVLVRELRLRVRFVRGDADDLRVVLREAFRGVAKLGRFLGSARRIGLGEEEDDHALTTELGELKRAGADVGRAIADLKSHIPRL